MLRRTWIARSLFAFLQFTGIKFTNSFAATFYNAQGLGANSFTYVVLGNVGQIISCLFQITITLAVGGSTPTNNRNAINAIIASVVLTQTFALWAVTNAFVIDGELEGVKMRKKSLASGGVVNMICAILVTAVTPYLMNTAPGSAGLGARVGWFFAAPSFLLFLFGLFVIPELKDRSLEETDELFAAGLQPWQFSRYKTPGTGAFITALQDNDSEKLRRASITELSIDKKTINTKETNSDRGQIV